MASFTRLLEWIFFLYFSIHIPITLLLDLQTVLPPQLYPQELLDLMKWYVVNFKDHMMMNPPAWFLSFCYCEGLLQLPFFPVAAYAFFKGGCRWIRIPAIVYSTHVVTGVIPMITHILFANFERSNGVDPPNQKERLTLASIYAPFLVIPLLILLTMLFSPRYKQQEEKWKRR